MTSDPLDLKSIVFLLRRQLRLILASVFLMLALALVYVVLVRPVYTATALVMVDPAPKSLLYGEDTARSASGENARVDSEVEILRSPTVALAVVRDQNLIADAEFGPGLSLADRFRAALGFESALEIRGEALVKGVLDRFMQATSVRRRGLTHVIAVSVSSVDADRAAALSNALAEAYIQAQLDSKVSGSLGSRDKLQGQVAAAQTALTGSEAAIDRYIEENLDRIETETGRADIAALRADLRAMDARRLETDLRGREAARALEREDWAALTARLGTEALAQLQAEREALQRRLGGAEPGSAAEIDLRGALAALAVDQERAAAEAIAALQAEGTALAATMRESRGALREALLAGELPSQVLSELYQLQQEATIARGQYQTLLSRMRELEVLAAVQMADSRIVSPALSPAQPSHPNRALVLGLGLVAGLGLGIGMAFLNEYYVGGITSEQQLREVMRVKVATALPLVVPRGEAGAAIADTVVTAPLGVYAEAVRRLRASLEHALGRRRGAGGQGDCILVTSANPAEGKSTTALALARAFAASGRSVILIDADLRRPGLHRVAGIDPARGMIDYLTDPGAEQETASFLVQDPLSQALLMPGRGRAHRETDQLLGAPIFARLVAAARSEFDIVILDAPPVLPVVDARYLAPFADAVVMAVQFAQTAQRDLRDALQVLSEVTPERAEVLCALNREPERKGGYHYAGYYGG